MYSAANDSLVMPASPRSDISGVLQVRPGRSGAAHPDQTLLPLCGALIIGTYIYLNRWGMMVAVDATPVVSVAVLYLASPWKLAQGRDHRRHQEPDALAAPGPRRGLFAPWLVQVL